MDIPTALQKIREMLQKNSPEGETALGEIREESRDPFKVLIATILSHRTKDANTTKASRQLFSMYDTPAKLADADLLEIQRLVKPSGFYRVKGRRIKEVATMIMEHYGGQVPDSVDALLSLPAVGRKTANCVLVYGFGKPAIPVDTHVHRTMNRLGFVSTKTPDKTEEALVELIDQKYWLELNELLVRFGQEICRPISPKCSECLLREECPYAKTKPRRGD